VTFNQLVLDSPRRLALPLAVYPGVALTGAKVSDIVTDPRAQAEAQAALQRRHDSGFLLSAMDLSLEAEAFGCVIAASQSEVPTVTGRLITSREQADGLVVPQPGAGRTGVPLEAVRRLRQLPGQRFVIGCCIGPFSLAARLLGVSEAMELTLADPGLMHALLEKSTAFLAAYAQAFRDAGAGGLLMAEPAAGLLSPRGLSSFSSAYVRRLAAGVTGPDFTIVLHNCGARIVHLPAILETGLKAFHFGAPMDIAAALGRVPPDVVLCGNLDPAGVFLQLPSEEVAARVRQLLAATSAYRNFVISSGCDLPADIPLANLDAFHTAVGPSEPPPDRLAHA
jgi:uroporphyrinogen decarboxylase